MTRPLDDRIPPLLDSFRWWRYRGDPAQRAMYKALADCYNAYCLMRAKEGQERKWQETVERRGK